MLFLSKSMKKVVHVLVVVLEVTVNKLTALVTVDVEHVPHVNCHGVLPHEAAAKQKTNRHHLQIESDHAVQINVSDIQGLTSLLFPLTAKPLI